MPPELDEDVAAGLELDADDNEGDPTELAGGFGNEFTHISESAARVADLPISLCAVLLAEACNIDLEALARRDVPALTRGRLLWIQQNYMRAETITRANARLVAAQGLIRLARAWGGGDVATADGLRFVVPVRTLNAAHNPKYFGRAHGATFFNFANDQFAGQGGVVVPGTPKDAPYLLAGLLEQWSGSPPTEIITDSGSYTDQMFGAQPIELLERSLPVGRADRGHGGRLARLRDHQTQPVYASQ